MFNLLRMDLYRAKRSKSLYVCFGILLIATVLTFGMVWLVETPEGQETAVRIGMLSASELDEMQDGGSLLEGSDSLLMFRQICLDGGAYNIIFGIWVMLFVCMDFQSGFIKNVMALYQNRWNYIGSKLAAAGIVNFCYLALLLLFTLLMNKLFGNMVPDARWEDIAFYLSWVWLLTTAFAALLIMICVLTRSVAAGALSAVLLGGGLAVSVLYSILNMFHIGEWLNHTIYMTLSMGPGHCASIQDLYVYATGAGFLLLYTIIAGIVLKRQDI